MNALLVTSSENQHIFYPQRIFQLISICITRDSHNFLYRFWRMEEKSHQRSSVTAHTSYDDTCAPNREFLFSRSFGFYLNVFSNSSNFPNQNKKTTTRDMKKTKLFLFTWMPWHAAETERKIVYLEKNSRVLQYECAQSSLIHTHVIFVLYYQASQYRSR